MRVAGLVLNRFREPPKQRQGIIPHLGVVPVPVLQMAYVEVTILAQRQQVGGVKLATGIDVKWNYVVHFQLTGGAAG